MEMKIPCTFMVQGIHKNNAFMVISTKKVQNWGKPPSTIMNEAFPLFDH